MADLTCEVCGRDNFRSERGLESHRRSKHPPEVEGWVYEQTVRAVDGADHLTDADAGAVAVLLTLARKIDGMPQRDPEAPLDNVTEPTYLKYSTELGLTPLARAKLPKQEGKSGSKLADLRAIRGGKAS